MDRNFNGKNVVYILTCSELTDLYKIGKSSNMINRLKSYHTSLPGDVKILYISELYSKMAMDIVEKSIHSVLHSYRDKINKEWFRTDTPDVFISEIKLISQFFNSRFISYYGVDSVCKQELDTKTVTEVAMEDVFVKDDVVGVGDGYTSNVNSDNVTNSMEDDDEEGGDEEKSVNKEEDTKTKESDIIDESGIIILKKSGKPFANKGKRWTTENDQMLISMFKEKRRMLDISKLFGRSQNAIYKRLNTLNVLPVDDFVKELKEIYKDNVPTYAVNAGKRWKKEDDKIIQSILDEPGTNTNENIIKIAKILNRTLRSVILKLYEKNYIEF